MLIIDRVSHYYDQQRALGDVSFECAGGRITCLIGPSGCGKTTLLRLVAGLLDLQSGSIHLDGEPLATPTSALPPERRPVGMVFQEGALFPHLTVSANIGFGVPREDRAARVHDLLNRVGLDGFADRYPDLLSGGQRQRVALARALAPEPRALLFDEPYANLDIQLRRTLREDARRMIRDTGTVGVFVTHDPEEVMAIADHVVVLDHGRIVQQGEPQALYDAPKSLHVAQLFGDSQTLVGTLDEHGLATAFGVWPRGCLIHEQVPSGPVTVVLRSHHLHIVPATGGLRVVEVRPAGPRDRVLLQGSSADGYLVVEMPRGRESPIAVGTDVRVEPDARTVFAVAKDAGQER